MKKILIMLLLCIAVYNTKAQTVTINNYSVCDVQYSIWASDISLPCTWLCKSFFKTITAGTVGVVETPASLTWGCAGTPPVTYQFVIAALSDATGASATIGDASTTICVPSLPSNTSSFTSPSCASSATWTNLGAGNIQIDIY